MRIEITLHSGISADGFEVEVITSKETTVMKNSFHYGYNASYYPANDKQKPYTTDIIAALMSAYKVKLEDVTIIPGKYMYNGDEMGEREVNEFKQKYMMELI